MTVLYLFIGGGCGTLLRYYFSVWIDSPAAQIPWQTFAANLVSCLILGFLFAYHSEDRLSANASLLLATGFCGGFSTFSTFSLENFRLIQSGEWFLAGAYILLSVVLCLIGIFIGYRLGMRFILL